MKIKAWANFDTRTVTTDFYFDDSIDSDSALVNDTVKRWATDLVKYGYVEVKSGGDESE